MGQGGLTQSWWAMQQRVIQRFVALISRFYKYLKVV